MVSLNIPPRAHWTVRRLYELLRQKEVGIQALTKRTGLAEGTVSRWRLANPRVHNIEAALNALGYEMRVVRMLPAAVAAADAWFEQREREAEAARRYRAGERRHRRDLAKAAGQGAGPHGRQPGPLGRQPGTPPGIAPEIAPDARPAGEPEGRAVAQIETLAEGGR